MTDLGWLTEFPDLAGTADEPWWDAVRSARPFQLAAGKSVFRPGDPCQNFVFVRRGSIRVHKASESGREILLYRVGRGEVCILTLFNLLGNTAYTAEGVAESDVEGAMITAAQFHKCLADCPSFRQFIFATIGSRLSNLMLLLEEVMFERLDVRLARVLIERHEQGSASAIQAKHSDLAAELGSSREVVSRILKDFEHRGWLQLARGEIRLLDPADLSRYALAKSGLWN